MGDTHALMADSVGLALFVALESVAPDERLAFLLHDVFGRPLEEIAASVGGSTAAARRLASRARRRVRGTVMARRATLVRQTDAIDTLLSATRAAAAFTPERRPTPPLDSEHGPTPRPSQPIEPQRADPRQAPAACLHTDERAQARSRRLDMKFVRPRQVLEMIGVSRTTLWRMVQAGTFPAPVRITQRNSGYVLEAVEEWMKARVHEQQPRAPRPHEVSPARPTSSPPLVLARSRRRNQ